MVELFKVLHNDAPPEDMKNLGGRIAGLIKQAGGDYLLVLQAIWKSSADGIVGSHLNYIQGYLRRGANNKPDTTDRSKFVKGKYGHMVKQ